MPQRTRRKRASKTTAVIPFPKPNKYGDPIIHPDGVEVINQVFDMLVVERGVRDAEVFLGAIPDRPTAYKALHDFLRDVTTCPPRVLEHARSLLNPPKSEMLQVGN